MEESPAFPLPYCDFALSPSPPSSHLDSYLSTSLLSPSSPPTFLLRTDQYVKIGHSITNSKVSTSPSYYQRSLLIGPLVIFILGILSLIGLNVGFVFRSVRVLKDLLFRCVSFHQFLMDRFRVILCSQISTSVSLSFSL